MFSCVSEEGQGGISTIQGKIFKVLHPNNNFTLAADTFPATKEDVYIVYDDEPIYGDKMETGYDGFYRFNYLVKGTYIVYAYSTLTDSRKVAVIDTVTVAYGATQEVSPIYIHEGKSYETSYIKGVVNVKYYNKNSGFTAYLPAYDQRVYLRIKNAIYQLEEVRTGLNGVFVFENLKPGSYEVFVFTEAAGTKVLSPVIQEITVDSVGVIKIMDIPFQIIINS